MRPTRASRFTPFLAALLGVALAGVASPARAELLVGSVHPAGPGTESVAAFEVTAYGPSEPGAAPIDAEELSRQAAAALVLFVGQLPPSMPRDPTTNTPDFPIIDPTPQIDPSHAPEPATLLSGLIGTGLAGLFTLYRRKKRRAV